VVASVVEAALATVLLYLGIDLLVHPATHVQWAALLPLALMVLSIMGYSLILDGITRQFKRVEVLKDLLRTAVLMFGGVFVSLGRMPAWVAAIARPLPLTPGMEELHKALIGGKSLGSAAGDGTLPWMADSAVIYLVLGVAIFRRCERGAKREGTLGRS